MTDITPARLAELKAVAEAAEPMMVFGGLAQTTFVSMEKSDVLALIAALEAKTAEAEGVRDELAAWMRSCQKARLRRDEARAEVERWQALWNREDGYRIDSDRRADRAEAALERVKALHAEVRYSKNATACDHCYGPHDQSVEWPCPTIRAIEGADDV